MKVRHTAAYWLYLRREVPVGGRPALAATRTGTIAILLLLLLDPSVPGDPVSSRDGGTWVAVDLSLSMDAGAEAGRRPWERARQRAAELREAGATVAGFIPSRAATRSWSAAIAAAAIGLPAAA